MESLSCVQCQNKTGFSKQKVDGSNTRHNSSYHIKTRVLAYPVTTKPVQPVLVKLSALFMVGRYEPKANSATRSLFAAGTFTLDAGSFFSRAEHCMIKHKGSITLLNASCRIFSSAALSSSSNCDNITDISCTSCLLASKPDSAVYNFAISYRFSAAECKPRESIQCSTSTSTPNYFAVND